MTALTPAQKERQRFARSRAGQIREGMRNYIATLAAIHTAWTEEDWKTLGYSTWQAYVDGEFGAERLNLPIEHRRKAVEELRLAGMSTRAIAETLDVDRNTVKRDLRQVGAAHPPEEVRGADGKTYRPARPPLVEAMTGAIEDAQQRAEDHREPAPGEAPTPVPDAEAGPIPPPASAPNPGVAAPEPDVGQATTPSGTAAAGADIPPAAAPHKPVLPGREGVGAPETSRTENGFSGSEEAGSPAGTGEPAPNLDEVIDAIQTIAAETGICPACQRPLES